MKIVYIGNLKKFLSEIESFVSKNKITSKTLGSVISRFAEIDFISILETLQNKNTPYFYTFHDKDEIIFLGFESISHISACGEDRLELTEKKVSELAENFLSNWDEVGLKSVPLFLGGMKFSGNNSDMLWKDFSDSDWFIPRFLLLKYKREYFLVYNFFGRKLINNEIKSDLNRLQSVLEYDKDEKRTESKIRILSTEKDKSLWVKNVKEALNKIEAGTVQKIVLSRELDLQLKSDISIAEIIETLGERYPKCYVFAFSLGRSVFFGASPEKLAKISNGIIEADALAGSIPRGKTAAEDDLLAASLLSSGKDIAEQQIVVSFITESFSLFCSEVFFEKKPAIRKLPNIQHLWTPIKGKVKEGESVFSILKELHPTPAICGVPWEKARNEIIKMEPHNRGLFTGMIGWFNFYNEGEFAVAIRSALLKEKMIYAFAGCGIVKGSDPEIEFAESELKLKPIISLFESIN